MNRKIDIAIARIQEAYKIAQGAGNALVCAYSGGKDSDVLLDLCIKAGVPFRAEHNHTGIDAPETVYHIREVFAGLEAKGIPTKINMPETTMWKLIAKKMMPPTRMKRYCCDYLKERKFTDRHLLLGVRWAESGARSTRGLIETIGVRKNKRITYMDENDDRRKVDEICATRYTIATNPIIDWSNADVWQYAKRERLKMNPLYACGFHRVGCVGCPLGTQAGAELERYPRIKAAYIRAFDRMLEVRKQKGKDDTTGKWRDAESVYKWWTDPKFDPYTMTLEDMEEMP